jgi:hypothetical protein
MLKQIFLVIGIWNSREIWPGVGTHRQCKSQTRMNDQYLPFPLPWTGVASHVEHPVLPRRILTGWWKVVCLSQVLRGPRPPIFPSLFVDSRVSSAWYLSTTPSFGISITAIYLHRIKIRFIEGNAKCRHLTKLTLRQVFICLRKTYSLLLTTS